MGHGGGGKATTGHVASSQEIDTDSEGERQQQAKNEPQGGHPEPGHEQ